MAARLGKARVKFVGEAQPAVTEFKRRLETALQRRFPGQVYKPAEGLETLGGTALEKAIEAEDARLQSFEEGKLEEEGNRILYRIEHSPADENGAPHEIRVLTPKRRAGSWMQVPVLTARLRQPGALKKVLTAGLARTLPEITVNDEKLAKIAEELARPKTAGTPKKTPLDSINGTGLVAAGQHHRLILETLKPFMPKGAHLVGVLNPYKIPDWQTYENIPADHCENLGRNTLLVTYRNFVYNRTTELRKVQNEYSHMVGYLEDPVDTRVARALEYHNPDKDIARITTARNHAGMPTGHDIVVYAPQMQAWADLVAVKLKQWYGDKHEVTVTKKYDAPATRA